MQEISGETGRVSDGQHEIKIAYEHDNPDELPAFSGKRILVGDDNEFVRRLIKYSLKNKSKFEVVTVEDGKMAITEALTGRHDAAIINLSESECFGPEVIRIIRTMMPGLPVFATIAKGSRRLDSIKPFSVTEVFKKPFRMSSMIKALKEVLKIEDCK